MTYIPTNFATYLQQGKSNSKIQDEANGFLNLGDAAKILSKKYKLKLLARHLEGFADTKHHAGVFKSSKGLKGRLVAMIAPDTLESITKFKLERILEAEIEATSKFIKGFYYSWDYDYSGSYGKKRNYKVLEVFEGFDAKLPKKAQTSFVELTDAQFEKASAKAGQKYYGWEEPTKKEFE